MSGCYLLLLMIMLARCIRESGSTDSFGSVAAAASDTSANEEEKLVRAWGSFPGGRERYSKKYMHPIVQLRRANSRD